MKTVYIETQGCQMNDYDSRRMLDLLKLTHGLEKVNEPEKADLLLVNTCAIREKAEEKVFSELGRWRKLKERRPGVIIGVGGCVAAKEGELIRKRAPYVDIVFGPQTLHRLPNMINAVTRYRNPVLDTSFPLIEKFDKLPDPTASGPTAYVSIMEGCSKYCSFCIVPYTRGEEVSRPFDDVLHEVVTLTEQGVTEITLLGQNVNAYRGAMHSGEMADLALLIQYLNEMESLKRIRFMTSHPAEFGTRLIEAYRMIPKLANHLHLPVQSGSDRILNLMKRGYTAKEYISKVESVRQYRPDISVTSDFIVGFPGETDKDFEATLELVESIQFDHSFSFIYSKREGTPAAYLNDDVPLSLKKERLARLQAHLRATALKQATAMLDTRQMVLVTGMAEKMPGVIQGRADNNRIVYFEGSEASLPPGTLAPVLITTLGTNTLRGTLCY